MTRHRIPFRVDFNRIFTILPSYVVNSMELIYVYISRKQRILRQNTSENASKNKKMPYFGAKTSDFLGTNIRTFHAKPPYFVAKKSEVSGFQPGNGTKIPFQPILRYFRTGQGTKAFEALLDPLTTQYERLKAYENGRRKILHTRHRFALKPAFSPSAEASE
ncbi:MAG: hypothetical protein MR517_01275 [Bacteroidales bacterium]|nr:hypothetical protein [Bacteroidales bacterium]